MRCVRVQHGSGRTQPSIGINVHGIGRGGVNRCPKDIGDIGPVIHLAKNTVDTSHGADGDNVIAGGDRSPRKVTQTHVFTAFGDTIPSPTAEARVVGAGGDVGQGDTANGCVPVTARVALERLIAYPRVERTSCMVR